MKVEGAGLRVEGAGSKYPAVGVHDSVSLRLERV